MKKSYKWNEEEHPRDQQRQRPKTEEPRKFPKHDSSRHKEDYFEDENKSMGYQRHLYQKERRPKTQMFHSELPPRFQAFKKVNYPMNCTEEQQSLGDAVKETKKFYHEENYKVHQGSYPLCPRKRNSYPDSMNQISKDSFSKPFDVRTELENDFPQVNDSKTECFSTRISSNEMNINEGNPSKNEMKHMHSSNENSLPVFQKCSTSLYESNQSTQYFSKQYEDQSNSHLSDNVVCTYDERLNSPSDNTYNASERPALLNFSSPHERYEFSTLQLIDLLYYNANLMQDRALFNFSTAVKSRILEAINNFPHSLRDELEVLCEITDGDQSEKNQQIITTRICRIVRNIIEKFPHVLNTLVTPPPPPTQMLINPAMPNLHGMTNICVSDNKSQFLKIVQNSEVILTSATDCNIMPNYKIVQNDKCIISKTTTDSFENTNSNDFKDSCEKRTFNTNNIENNSTINSVSIAEENMVKESSNHHSLPMNSGEEKSAHRLSFNEENNYFASFKLDKLLNFNSNAMHGDAVFEYAFSMKQRILEKINNFKDPYKDKLKLVCELTDGTQREHNQKLINDRMCDLIDDFKDAIGQKRWKKFLDDESEDVQTKRSNDENEMPHEHRQNIDRQSRKMHPRRLYGEDEVIYEDRQNFLEQSKEVHTESHDENEIHYGHRQNADGQSTKIHSRRSYDEVMHEDRQNLTEEQSRNVHSRRSQEVVHEHQQNFSDVYSRNTHLRRSHEVVHAHRQNFPDEQPKNIHPRRSHDEMVHEHNQNFPDGQLRNAHPRELHDEVFHVHRQNCIIERSKIVQSRKLYSDNEMVHVHQQNFTDEQSKKAQSRKLYSDDEMVQHEYKQNFSDGQSRNVHARSHYKDETGQHHRENLDGQSKNAHTRSSHYSDIQKR